MIRLLVEILVILAFFALLVLAILRQSAAESRRRMHESAARFERWAAWYEGQPKPGSPKYNDWPEGGSERFRADLAAYPPEPKVRSLN
jgi:hypothetical protein